MILERLENLRALMAERNIDIYLVPTSDFHESEYVGEHFKARKFITGFTGSAGTAVITMTEAGLWTDGRYFIQAATQLEGTGITLFRMGEEGVPTVYEYIDQNLKESGSLGFDGRVVNAALGSKLAELVNGKKGSLHVEEDLIDKIWTDRPVLSKEPAFLLDIKYAGESAAEKLSRLREKMGEKDADYHIMSSLDDIAWLFNIRGNDARHFPIVLSYAVVSKDASWLFIHDEVLNDEIRASLEENHVEVRPYDSIYDFVNGIEKGQTVWMDNYKVNYRIYSNLNKEVKKVNAPSPVVLMKAIKNKVELDNIREAHRKDGIAFTKFMHWLKTHVNKEEISEISASDYLEARRREQPGFIDLSFDTICAYEANAAMMHYSATPDSNAKIDPKGFLLVDSGGHYFEGSTDITRTMALGPITDQQKTHFTHVLRSNLNLAAAKFLYGCRGQNLDILSRGPLWEIGLDYKCGTGHGVGYILNIHEAPNGFRWKIVPERNDSAILEEGMVTTDEPGVYLEGEYGIRTENELICKKAEKNEYGQFMEFEAVTYAPIDLDAVDPELMSKRERQLLNDYHKMVYEKLAPDMSAEELEWLKEYTREI